MTLTDNDMLIVCDTNCWIEASGDPKSSAAQFFLSASERNCRIACSKHSLVELAAGTLKYGSDAETLARNYCELPYCPIGTFNELVGTISELAGTLADMRANEVLREQLGELAKQGTSVRDRGALIDAVRAGAAYFVTADRGLTDPGPRTRIERMLPIRIRTPTEINVELFGRQEQACDVAKHAERA